MAVLAIADDTCCNRRSRSARRRCIVRLLWSNGLYPNLEEFSGLRSLQVAHKRDQRLRYPILLILWQVAHFLDNVLKKL
jgi:hypothetical protein